MRPAAKVALAFAGVALAGVVTGALLIGNAPSLATGSQPVPRVIELPVDEARAALERLGFRARVADERPHPSAPRGTVIFQDPPPALQAPRGTTVALDVSAGTVQVTVPDATGLELPIARQLLESAGLRAGDVLPPLAPGTRAAVLRTTPAAGTPAPLGSRVTLVVTRTMHPDSFSTFRPEPVRP